MSNKKYDVVIAGSGISATMQAAILAKNGLSVLMIESDRHPRFALGEAMLPQSTLWAFIIGEYYDIPEIKILSDTNHILEKITSSCGIKHSIAFAYHEKEEELNENKVHQFIPPHMPFYSESHLLREDIDLYLLGVAINYGSDYLEDTKITQVNFLSKEVEIVTNRGEYKATYYIDASGKNSKIAQQLNLRKDAVEAKTHSRTIFTHVSNLDPFDELIMEFDFAPQSRRYHDGTMHHVFKGGWIWVIPFDNTDKSNAKLASIGLTLDTRVFPENSLLSPEEEFKSIIRQFPTIHKHLGNLTNTRPYIRTGRLQYSASQSVGDHFML